MKKSSELVKQVSREIIAEGINLEIDYEFGDVNGERGIVYKDYAYIGPGSYDGVEGFYFKRGDENETKEINLIFFQQLEFIANV